MVWGDGKSHLSHASNDAPKVVQHSPAECGAPNAHRIGTQVASVKHGSGARVRCTAKLRLSAESVDILGAKASNPVVSTDGRFMAFQSARAKDPAGVGYGILLYWFNK